MTDFDWLFCYGTMSHVRIYSQLQRSYHGTHYLNKALKDNSKIIGAKGMPELSQDSIILVQNVIDNQCQSAKQTVVLSAFVIKFSSFLWFMKERM